MNGLLRGVAASSLLVLSSRVGAALETARTSERRFEIGFGEHLRLSDIRLAGAKSAKAVAFVCEADWKVLPGTELHLFLSHSPDVDGERSFTTVSVNWGLLRSFRLDEHNRDVTEIVIPLPPAMLRESNELLFAVEQTVAGTDGTPWTLISSRSYVTIRHEAGSRRRTLGDLPAPLVDPRSYRPQTLAVLRPSDPSPATLEAIALVLANVSSRVPSTPIRLRIVGSPAETDDPLVVVGTPGEQPHLSALPASKLEFRDASGGSQVALAGGGPLDGASGVAVLATGESARPSLYITANSPEGVWRAARGLFAGGAGLDADVAVLSEDPSPRRRKPREWLSFAPPKSRFLLAELGHSGARWTLLAEQPVRVGIRMTPDTRFVAEGHEARLELQTRPNLFDDPEARIEIQWNDVLLKQLPVREVPPNPQFSMPVRIPAAALRHENVLTIASKRAAGTGAAGPLLSLQGESELYLPRDYEAKLPDLGLLQASLYPLSLRADLSDVIVVVPDGVLDDAFVLLCEFSSFLGRSVPTDRLDFRVRTVSALTAEERVRAHLVLLRAAAGTDAFDAALPDWRGVPRSGSLKTLPVLQEAVSPWDRGKYVLSLRASSTSSLLRAFRRLSDPDVLRRLRGDTAFLSAGEPVCFTVGHARTVREVLYLTRIEAWLRSNWLALPLILTVVSALLFVGLRLVLGHRRSLRMPQTSKRARRPLTP